MANQYSDPGIINAQTYVDNLDASIELMKIRPDEYNAELEEFFHPIPAESTTFKMSSVSSIIGLPLENADEDNIPASIPAPGYDKTFTLVEYRIKVEVTRLFMQADRFGKGATMAGGLPNSTGRKKEYLRALIFSNAFTSGTGADGAYMIADSHTPENPLGSSRDNNISGALNVDNWHAMRLVADQQVNELGYPMPGDIKTLLAPPALRRKATELRQATLDPETVLNTPMVLTDFTIKIGHFLSSSTAYFGFTGKMGMDKGMYYVYLPPEGDIADCKPSDNPDIIWAKRARMVCTFGFDIAVDYVYGSTGA